MTNTKCLDAVSTKMWMLSKSGVWPVHRMGYFDWFKLLINWFYALSFLVLMLIEMVRVCNDYQKLAEMLDIMVPYEIYCYKLFAFIYNKDYFFCIMNDINSTIFNSHQVDLYQPIIRTIQISKAAEKTFEILMFILLMIYLVYPIIDHTALPVPFSYELEEYYYFMYCYQISGLILTAWNISCTDLLFMSFAGLAAAQIDILRTKLIKCRYDENLIAPDENVTVALRDCIELHIVIIRFLENINGVFSGIIFVQYVSEMILICNFVIELCFLVDTFSTKFARSCAFLIVVLTEMLLYHWFGNEVIEKSNKIGEAIYFSEWYRFNSSNKKILFILMERTKQPLTLKIYKFTDVSLASFGVIIRWSYSLFGVIRNMVNRRD